MENPENNPSVVDPVSQRLQGCLDIEDDAVAFACLKETVRELASQPCAPRIVLFTREGCPYCAESKANLGQDLADGAIQEISIDTPEGMEAARKIGVEYFPTLTVLDCNGKELLPGS